MDMDYGKYKQMLLENPVAQAYRDFIRKNNEKIDVLNDDALYGGFSRHLLKFQAVKSYTRDSLRDLYAEFIVDVVASVERAEISAEHVKSIPFITERSGGNKKMLMVGTMANGVEVIQMLRDFNNLYVTSMDPTQLLPEKIFRGRGRIQEAEFWSDKRKPGQGTDITNYDIVFANRCCPVTEDIIFQCEEMNKPYYLPLCTDEQQCNRDAIDGTQFENLDERYAYFQKEYGTKLVKLNEEIVATNMKDLPKERFTEITN